MGTHPGWDWWQWSPRTRSSSQVMRRWTVCFTLVLCSGEVVRRARETGSVVLVTECGP